MRTIIIAAYSKNLIATPYWKIISSTPHFDLTDDKYPHTKSLFATLSSHQSGWYASYHLTFSFRIRELRGLEKCSAPDLKVSRLLKEFLNDGEVCWAFSGISLKMFGEVTYSLPEKGQMHLFVLSTVDKWRSSSEEFGNWRIHWWWWWMEDRRQPCETKEGNKNQSA